ncbi:DUF1206 domain-containing protein [Micrococcoides hystricis]|uniref:DUF1206 domain-containing protein n=1 Tax=Micrococcoides hystricis TaxID=1572761 RepID=A0ABV6PAK4_9MICC
MDKAKGTANKGADVAEQVTDSPWFRRAARAGYIANGVIHLVLGVIAWNLAFGGGGEQADQSGAVRTLSEQPFGMVLIWFCMLGAFMLGLWHVSEAIFAAMGRTTKDKSDRAKETVKGAGKAIAFFAIASTCITFAFGGDKDSGDEAQSLTATLMSNPAGAILLYAIGAGLVIAGGFYVYKGVSKKFEEDLKATSRKEISKAITVTGVIGHAAKGLVLAAVGLLFIVATAKNNPEESTGIDGALKAMLDQPFGQPLLAAVGAGLVLFGIYLFMRSAYDRMD